VIDHLGTGKLIGNIYRNLVTKIRKQSIRAYFQNKCEGTENKNNFWQTIKPFISNKSHSDNHIIILKEGDNIISNPNEVCQIFNDYYANVAMAIGFVERFVYNDSNIESLQQIFTKYKDHPSVMCIKNNVGIGCVFCFKYVNESDVLKALKELDVKKACGYEVH
jgi:hypothetical protein